MPSPTREIDSAGPSRRAVVRGAAWALPVISVAATAPAFAASNCAPVSIVWSSLAPDGTQIPDNSTQTFGGVTIGYDLSGSTRADDNSTVWSRAQTGGSSSALRLYNENTKSTAETVVFSFSKPVKNVSLSLLDIDRSTWEDQVVVNTTGFIGVKGSTVQGSGTATDPYKPTGTAAVIVADNSATGNVALSWVGPVNQISLTYRQWGSTVSGNPHIGLSNIAFTPVTC